MNHNKSETEPRALPERRRRKELWQAEKTQVEALFKNPPPYFHYLIILPLFNKDNPPSIITEQVRVAVSLPDTFPIPGMDHTVGECLKRYYGIERQANTLRVLQSWMGYALHPTVANDATRIKDALLILLSRKCGVETQLSQNPRTESLANQLNARCEMLMRYQEEQFVYLLSSATTPIANKGLLINVAKLAIIGYESAAIAQVINEHLVSTTQFNGKEVDSKYITYLLTTIHNLFTPKEPALFTERRELAAQYMTEIENKERMNSRAEIILRILLAYSEGLSKRELSERFKLRPEQITSHRNEAVRELLESTEYRPACLDLFKEESKTERDVEWEELTSQQKYRVTQGLYPLYFKYRQSLAPSNSDDVLYTLSPRERQILELFISGTPIEEIPALVESTSQEIFTLIHGFLDIESTQSRHTYKSELAHLYEKLLAAVENQDLIQKYYGDNNSEGVLRDLDMLRHFIENIDEEYTTMREKYPNVIKIIQKIRALSKNVSPLYRRPRRAKKNHLEA